MKIDTLVIGPIQTNCYILSEEGEVVVIDPGGDADEISQVIRKHLDDSKELKIINTHYHYDHVLANNELKEEFQAKISIHENEKEYMDFQADDFLKEGDEIKIGKTKLKVIHTPGHTQGCICLLGEDFVFSGDTIFEQGVGRTDLPGGDMRNLEESIQKISKYLKNGMVVYPGHGNHFAWDQNIIV